MDFIPTIPELIALVVILLFAFPVHEMAHAWTAHWFGDDTPRSYGRLTLNPLAHLDPLGSLMLFVTQQFGWAKPVPVNVLALERRSQYAPMWVALAGPLSNLAMAALAVIPFRLGLVSPFAQSGTLLPSPGQVLDIFVKINLILMLFNLIPVFPLDGEKVLTYILPPSSRGLLDQVRPYGMLILMVLVFIGPTFGLNILTWIIGPPFRTLYFLLIG